MFGNKLSKVDKLVEHKKGDGLAALGHDKNQEVRLHAIAGMGKVGGDACYNTLVSLLRDPDPAIRGAAAAAMAQLGDPRARGHIEHQLAQETDPQVKPALKAALAKIHGEVS